MALLMKHPNRLPAVIAWESPRASDIVGLGWFGDVLHPPVLRVVGGCLLTYIGAQVRVPIPGTPVPMTLQLLAVLLAGLWLTSGQAVASMMLYLMLGTAGLPVFSEGFLSLGLAGITGGYLVGFVAAVWVMSVLRGQSCSLFRAFGLCCIGVGVVFFMGVCWQAVLIGNFVTAMKTGLLPFLPKALIEVASAAGLYHLLRRNLVRRRI